jgi:outer membrane receptor protein involved in Fe transport
MHKSIVAAIACLAMSAIHVTNARAAAHDLESTVEISIDPQPLSSALLEFSAQTGMQVVTSGADVRALNASGVHGRVTVKEALEKLLSGSGLVFRLMGENTVGLTKDESGPSARDPGNITLEEVLVTAQKREERLQDVPVPVSVVDAASLASNNQLRLQDYYATIPGLSLVPGAGETSNIAIRGLTTGGGANNPTVAIVIDDVPFGSSTFWGGGDQIPDIDPSDLAHIEVLRGPQGTLYGASSLGGLLKFVTVDPSTDHLSGHVQLSVNHIRNANDPGYAVRGVVNVPIGETLALRASGFTRDEAGYVDNPGLGIEGVNEIHSRGGRLAAVWRPSDGLSLKFSAYLQHTADDGSSFLSSVPGLTDLQQRNETGAGRYEKDAQAYSLTLNARLGSLDLTALSGYNSNELSGYDDAPQFNGLSNAIFGVSGATHGVHPEASKFTQEIRLGGLVGTRVHWLGGLFYTDESSEFPEDVQAIDPSTRAVTGSVVSIGVSTDYTEYAAFGSLTFDITDRFDLQIGARESYNEQHFVQRWAGPFVPLVFDTPSPFLPPRASPQDNAFTYLITPRFRFSQDLMTYARFASGYRAGGATSNNTLNVLPTFAPDTTQNYELGVKGDIFDRALSFDASIYYIDWKDVQLQVIDPRVQTVVYTNGSRAKSQGAEISLQSRPSRGLELGGWVAWNDARLTEDFPPGSFLLGRDGDRLPASPRLSGSFSIGQEFSLTETLTASMGGSVSYVGTRRGNFTDADRQILPGYARTDVRVGVSAQSWDINLFLNNATDRRGVLMGGLGTSIPERFYYIQPRTIGLSIAKTFE